MHSTISRWHIMTNNFTFLTILLFTSIVQFVVASPQPDTSRKHVTIVNNAGIETSVVDQVRLFAEANLYVPVVVETRASASGKDLASVGANMAKLRTSEDACLIVFVSPNSITSIHATMLTNAMVTVINADAMKTNDAAKYLGRLERQVVRGTAFLFGIGPDPDPHCVMHDYRTLEDLDKMGLNFSPPWGEMFRKAAASRGLEVRPMFKARPPKATSAK